VRILVTGGTGFIGTRLVEKLNEMRHDVWELRRYDAHRLPANRVIYCDLKDGDVYAAVYAAHPEVILHLGALASNDIANQQPIESMLVNGVGTARMVDAAKSLKNLRAFVLASSSEVYGRAPGVAEAINPYAASKMAAEQVVRGSGLPFVIMRPFNTYGRAKVHMPKFVVDEALHQAASTGEINLRDPNPFRDFIFRDDHVGAYLSVVGSIERERLDILGETFEFGSQESVRIQDMAEIVAKEAGIPAEKVTFRNAVREGDAPLLIADSTKAREMLGWEPKFTLEAGLKQALAEWREEVNAHSIAVS
jgi:nucleoside-diphosphate-sugar epimerase